MNFKEHLEAGYYEYVINFGIVKCAQLDLRNPNFFQMSAPGMVEVKDDIVYNITLDNNPIFYAQVTLECPHDWLPYHGLTNSFEHCDRCPEKREWKP